MLKPSRRDLLSLAAGLAALVNTYARAIDMADLVKRMEALEAKIKGTE